jgi:ferredoxin
MMEGLCPRNISDINIVSEKDIDELRISFESPITFSYKRLTDSLKKIILLKLFCNLCEWILSVKPQIDKQLCRGCGICVKGCPRRAIEIVDNISRINNRKCIRCYCCHELCPYGSIHLKVPLVNKIHQRFVRNSVEKDIDHL